MGRKSSYHKIIRAGDLRHPEKYQAAILAKDHKLPDRPPYNGMVIPAGEKTPIYCRSRWEMVFVEFCDTNQDILEWASEPWEIPYRNPTTGEQTVYVPDFLVAVRGATGKITKMLIEIKPQHEALIEQVRNKKDAAAYMANQAKWKAAAWFCQRRGIKFKIMTEAELFGSQPTAPKKRARTR